MQRTNFKYGSPYLTIHHITCIVFFSILWKSMGTSTWRWTIPLRPTNHSGNPKYMYFCTSLLYSSWMKLEHHVPQTTLPYLFLVYVAIISFRLPLASLQNAVMAVKYYLKINCFVNYIAMETTANFCLSLSHLHSCPCSVCCHSSRMRPHRQTNILLIFLLRRHGFKFAFIRYLSHTVCQM